MFELGEKVVCIHNFKESGNSPSKNEIVTIKRFHNDNDKTSVFLVLEEYRFDSDGTEQGFLQIHFRKLDRKFTADLIESLCKGQEKENLITI